MHQLDPRARPRRATLAAALSALLAAVLGAAVLGAAPASAAPAYRFWGFYQLAGGAWTFAQKGPDQVVPKDGAVDGWRFAVGEASSSRFPRAVPTFEQLCAATPTQEGKKRVGLVVDFGRPADSETGVTPPEPRGLCASVDQAATSTDVLATAGPLRSDKGLVCAVAGYPATGCGGEVKQVSPEAKAADTPVQLALPGAAPSATPAAGASAAATESAAAPATAGTSSGGSTAAYVLAGLALLALVVFLVLRARGGARRQA
ncbi:MAG TPA: SCO2322 family protein [Intrasporangium sp.]|uniref:SCO2322 family protein n=1 Tax=Intrasporangium sp. TaxID=1925024 RepID=UPI002D78B3FC|nr:SCO2322 family protein [Intrasporangium sp.]HET7397467.1 SCO2322 family protein [Intrasporangium sp.]